MLYSPMAFSALFASDNIPIVQVHSLYDEHTLGFCGQFKWENDRIIPLDGDSYNPYMTVIAFEWFEHDGQKCLDILVDTDW